MRERNEREGDPLSTRESKVASYGSLKRLPALEVTTQPLSAKKQLYSSSGLLITWCGVVSLALFAASSFTAVSDSRLRGMKEVSSTPFKPVTHPLQPSKLLKNWEAPLPTGGWWTNAVLETPEGETGPIHPLPYAVKTAAAGLTVSYSVDRRNVGTTALSDVFATDIVFRASGSFTSRQVESSTPLSMTYSYSASRGSGGMMKAILVRGAPFITCEYSSLWPVLDASTWGIFSVVAGRGQADGRSLTSAAESSSCASNAACGSLGLTGNCCPTDEGVLLGCCSSSDSGIASSGDDTSGGNGGDDVPTTPSSFSHSSVTGSEFLVELRNGQRWAVYTSADADVTLNWDANSIWLDGAPDSQQESGAATKPPSRMVIRLARVLSQPAEEVLRKYSQVYPTGGTLSWEKRSSNQSSWALLKFNWQVASMRGDKGASSEGGDLIMMPLPHHLHAMQRLEDSSAPVVVDDLSFVCTKGSAGKVVVGTEWQLRYDLTRIGFLAPDPIDESLAADTNERYPYGGAASESPSSTSAEDDGTADAETDDNGSDGSSGDDGADDNGNGNDDNTSSSADCTKYPACAALGLTGVCCPTISNGDLDCCVSGRRLDSGGASSSAVILAIASEDVDLLPPAASDPCELAKHKIKFSPSSYTAHFRMVRAHRWLRKASSSPRYGCTDCRSNRKLRA